MSSKPKAIILDAFNTLFHNEPKDWAVTFVEICRAQHLPIDADTLWARWKKLEVKFRESRTNLQNPDDNPPFMTYEEAWRSCFEQVFGELGAGDAEAAAKMSVRDMSKRPPFQDTMEALGNLRGKTRIAILSNADDAFLLPLLRSHDVDEVEFVLTSEAVGAYKPHPKPFKMALQIMNLRPEEAIYVGDNLFDDVYGAHSVGMCTVWINRHRLEYDPKLPKPDHTISTLTELTKFTNSN